MVSWLPLYIQSDLMMNDAEPVSAPTSVPPFTTAVLRAELQKTLVSLNYKELTPIQLQSLPLMLKSNDVIAQAKTGSGKTAAFGLSILNYLKIEFFGAQALILCPTRELADQVSQVLRRLACFMPNVKVVNLSGGIPMKAQLDSLRHGAHIIVGTPGRILKHINAGSLHLNKIRTLVLDEADRMLDMGFLDDITSIIAACPQQRQTLLFSATFSDEIKEISKQFMINPQHVVTESAGEDIAIEQVFFEVAHKNHKFKVLHTLLLHYQPSAALIFCNTKQHTIELTDLLIAAGFSAAALNGDMEQNDRDLAVIRFANHSCPILVATDVAARGLDIKELPAVINYELAFEPEVHVHRIGRTGRAGNQGLALSIVTPSDAQRVVIIEDQLQQKVTWGKIEELDVANNKIPKPEMVTLCLAAGKKDKIRPGDILGALTKDAGFAGTLIGKIHITALYSYVAIHKSVVDNALSYLQTGKIKGKKTNARIIK